VDDLKRNVITTIKFFHMRIFLVLISAVFFQNTCSAQSTEFRDSIREHYLKNGAWHHSIYSKEYGQYIDSALAVSPHDAFLWQQRGMPYFKQMKYQQGMPYIDSAVKYDTTEYLPYRAFLKCIFQKDYLGAITDFTILQHDHPNAGVMDHEFNFYLGLCALQLSQYDKADKLFSACLANDRALGGNWVHPLHLFYLGVARRDEGMLAGAIICFDSALIVYPHFSDAEYYKAVCLEATGQHDASLALQSEARDDFMSGYTINEDNAVYERYPYQVERKWFDAAPSAAGN
jgi:tetratricopeptide (TPR) repeat protein